MFCLRYDFPTEWLTFVNTGSFSVTLQKSFFPYIVQNATLTVSKLTLYAQAQAPGATLAQVTPTIDLAALSASLNASGSAPVPLPSDTNVMTQNQSQQVFLVLQYYFRGFQASSDRS